ncbi:MAG: class I SAM-dependent methyltransferase [Streptosporangiaceae bacterium]
MKSRFAAGEQRWRDGPGTLRQVVRQELVARQLAAHLPPAPPRQILDAGCGQGTQVLRLARLGHHVTGLDSSHALLADLDTALTAEPPEVRDRVRVACGDALRAGELLTGRRFDAVLCHGVLMYQADPRPLLRELASLVTAGGIVSLLARNADGLAMRPGLLGDWTAARRAFTDTTYGNRIGVTARADHLEELAALLGGLRLSLRAWYGVRVFTDTAASDAPAPADPALTALLDCEEQAGTTDPYRRVAALTHVIAERA